MVTKKETPEVDPWEDDEKAPPRVVEHVGTPDRDGAVITLKAGTGYDAPWIVIHATSQEDAINQLSSDVNAELMDLTARKAKEFARAFGGPATASAQPKAASSGGGWGKKPSGGGSTDQPSGTCPTHNCDLVFADSFSKRDGTKVSARVGCPVPKCYAKTFWQNDDGSWTEK